VGDDGKLKVKDNAPTMEKRSTNNVKTFTPPNPPPSNPQGQGGVTPMQWTVIGLLLILLVLEIVIHPTFQANVLGFLKAFNPGKPSSVNNTPLTPAEVTAAHNRPPGADIPGATLT
jgi:hypothetical protein